MQKLTLGIAVLALIVSGFAISQIIQKHDRVADATSYQKDSFLEGLTVGTGRQLQVSRLGVLTSSTSTYLSTFTQGGGANATTSSTSVTVASSVFDTENLIEMTPANGATTATLPTSTTFPLSTTVGATRQFAIFNATGTAGISITVLGNTGVGVSGSSTASTTPVVIGPRSIRWFTAIRKSDSNIEVNAR